MAALALRGRHAIHRLNVRLRCLHYFPLRLWDATVCVLERQLGLVILLESVCDLLASGPLAGVDARALRRQTHLRWEPTLRVGHLRVPPLAEG